MATPQVLELSKATKDKYHAMSMVNLVDKKLIFERGIT